MAVGDFNGDGRLDAGDGQRRLRQRLGAAQRRDLAAADAPSITIGDVTVTEGNTGTVNATFTVSLSAASGQP